MLLVCKYLKRHNCISIDLGNEGPVLGWLCVLGRLDEHPEDSMKMGLVTLYDVVSFATKRVCLEFFLFFCLLCMYLYFYCIFHIFTVEIKILVFLKCNTTHCQSDQEDVLPNVMKQPFSLLEETFNHDSC